MQVKIKEGIYMEVDSDDWMRFLIIRNMKPRLGLHIQGYARFCVGKQQFLFHRWVMDFPDYEIDHIDHNKLNNTRQNLRLVSGQENQFNRETLNKNNTSGCTGVYFNKKIKRWVAQICINHCCVGLGNYSDIKDAINARKDFEKRYRVSGL